MEMLPRCGPFGAVLLLLGGCASPADTFEAAAACLGLNRSHVEGAGFRHAVFANDAPATDGLRVYIDGDGTPYLGRAIATDPTPRRSLALVLLAEDKGPALYLGRPCHHGDMRAGGCSSELWTRARYGEAVVASMAAAVRHLIKGRGARTVTLIGHSGGGTLAMLIAPRIPETAAVVTIGANLDLAAWARHARQDLSGSVDPAALPPLSAGIRQFHYAGGQDQVVPFAITASGLHGPSATLAVIAGFDHVCCWASLWPAILARLDAGGSGGQPASFETPGKSRGRVRTPFARQSRRRRRRSSRFPGWW